MKLYIKYMVSLRCKMVVKDVLAKMGIVHAGIDLGVVETIDDLSDKQLNELSEILLLSGLELMENKKAVLIEKIKNIIVEMIHYTDELPRTKYSTYISEKLGLEYTGISKLFSEVNGITIEHFIIIHKIERVKELLIYNELNLTQISYIMNYSSVSHLSKQFKKVTGLTPSFFKNLKENRRGLLEDI